MCDGNREDRLDRPTEVRPRPRRIFVLLAPVSFYPNFMFFPLSLHCLRSHLLADAAALRNAHVVIFCVHAAGQISQDLLEE